MHYTGLYWIGKQLSQVHALKAIGPEAKKAAPQLLTALTRRGDNISSTTHQVLVVLVGLGADAVPALIEGLKNKNEHIRREAAGVCIALGPKAKPAIPALTEAIGDSNADVREAAIKALVAIEGKGSKKK